MITAVRKRISITTGPQSKQNVCTCILVIDMLILKREHGSHRPFVSINFKQITKQAFTEYFISQRH